MAAPTPPRLAASFNDAVCVTPSPTIEARRAPPLSRPSTPITVTDSEPTTDHSPTEEWKEVVSKKKKVLKASTSKEEEPPAQRRRTPPPEQPRKIQRTLAPRASPPAPVPASKPLLSQKQQEEAKCMLSGCGKSYSIHEKYDLDEVRTLLMNNGKQGTIVKAYRLPDEDGNSSCMLHKRRWTALLVFPKGPFFQVPFEEVLRRYTEVYKSHSSRQQHDMVQRPRKMLRRYRPLKEVSTAGTQVRYSWLFSEPLA